MGLSECIWSNVFTNWTKKYLKCLKWPGQFGIVAMIFCSLPEVTLSWSSRQIEKMHLLHWDITEWSSQVDFPPIERLEQETRQKLDSRLGKSMRKIKNFQTINCNYKYLSVETTINCNFNQKSMRKGSNCWNSLVPGSLFLEVPNAQDPMRSAWPPTASVCSQVKKSCPVAMVEVENMCISSGYNRTRIEIMWTLTRM